MSAAFDRVLGKDFRARIEEWLTDYLLRSKVPFKFTDEAWQDLKGRVGRVLGRVDRVQRRDPPAPQTDGSSEVKADAPMDPRERRERDRLRQRPPKGWIREGWESVSDEVPPPPLEYLRAWAKARRSRPEPEPTNLL